MFRISCEAVSNRVHKYAVTGHGQPVSYEDVLNPWQRDNDFLTCFISHLADSPFTAYRWETPPVTHATANRNFEFVLLDAPGLARNPDTRTYAEHFTNARQDGIVVFENLGKDTSLVVPAPITPESSYEHLAAFIRSAPDSQKQAFWRMVGQTVLRKISDRPLWLGTAGGGVAWLHARLDSRPKYYGYTPYKKDL